MLIVWHHARQDFRQGSRPWTPREGRLNLETLQEGVVNVKRD